MADFDEHFDEEEKEVNVYGQAAREALEENDEISPEEGAFMEGYETEDEGEDETEDEEYTKSFTEEDEQEEESNFESEEEF